MKRTYILETSESEGDKVEEIESEVVSAKHNDAKIESLSNNSPKWIFSHEPTDQKTKKEDDLVFLSSGEKRKYQGSNDVNFSKSAKRRLLLKKSNQKWKNKRGSLLSSSDDDDDDDDEDKDDENDENDGNENDGNEDEGDENDENDGNEKENVRNILKLKHSFFETEADDDGFVVSDSEPINYDSQEDDLDKAESSEYSSEEDIEIENNNDLSNSFSAVVNNTATYIEGRLYLMIIFENVRRLYTIPIEYFRKSKLRFMMLYFILSFKSNKEHEKKHCILSSLDFIRISNSFPKVFDHYLKEYKNGLDKINTKKMLMIWEHLLRIKINENRLKDVPLRELSLDEENFILVNNDVSFFNPISTSDIVTFFSF
jgi:hypothetical protein